MLRGWMLWKYLIKRAARAYDLLDPFSFLSRMHQFSEPSEVQEPIELLRAGIVFHARGLINTKAIQHNLDWVWPYWVERQFDPQDVSFIPRAFSFSHVNLTHRNWTTVGLPDEAIYPIIDPRGLITPLYDGWSVDFWIINRDGTSLLPSRLPEAAQHWTMEDSPGIMTDCRQKNMGLTSKVGMQRVDGKIQLDIEVHGRTNQQGWLVIGLRPYNPEGIQFIEQIRYDDEKMRVAVNNSTALCLQERPERVCLSKYIHGDVLGLLGEKRIDTLVNCKTGMATGALLFPLTANQDRKITCTMPLHENDEINHQNNNRQSWPEVLEKTAALRIPDKRLQRLYGIAVRTVIHLTAAEPFPGPYTYRRFWYRDACFMLNALLGLGLEERCGRLLEKLPDRQQAGGYYHSQNGEWDSNGQVLWIVNRFQKYTGRKISERLLKSVILGADWIKKKRRETTGRQAGLLPPGFSAEHFGPNDYYYWDDFWAVAGLQGAARLAGNCGKNSAWIEKEAEVFFKAIIASLSVAMNRRSINGMPASPNRRLDAGAIGSLAADYPLQLFEPDHPWVTETVSFLLEHCMQKGGFFQDIIHSGINAYLTLDLAQTLLRSGDSRFKELVSSVAELASSTGQWPEAIHPLTGGGCMGDGQHGWAAAEWILMLRNMFIREEGESLIIGSGIFPEWLQHDCSLSFGPTPTPYGNISIEINRKEDRCVVHIIGKWRETPPQVCLRIPGFRHCDMNPDHSEKELQPIET
ncbi:MAG: hypothetical protein KQH63_19420 [Desulfobulbaceae bacterium]|nr:hypothetical protein [Desulfobulbaceae bacterium]